MSAILVFGRQRQGDPIGVGTALSIASLRPVRVVEQEPGLRNKAEGIQIILYLIACQQSAVSRQLCQGLFHHYAHGNLHSDGPDRAES